MKQLFIAILCWFLLNISFNSAAQGDTVSNSRTTEIKKKHRKLKKMKDAHKAKSMVGATNFNLDQIKQQIKETNKIFSTALVNGDSAAIAGIFHSQTIIYPANMPSMNSGSEMGRIAILIPAMGIKSMEITSTDIFGNADMVVETGSYSLGNGKQQLDTGRYIVVWKEEGGKWKIYRDIWNSDGLVPKE